MRSWCLKTEHDRRYVYHLETVLDSYNPVFSVEGVSLILHRAVRPMNWRFTSNNARVKL